MAQDKFGSECGPRFKIFFREHHTYDSREEIISSWASSREAALRQQVSSGVRGKLGSAARQENIGALFAATPKRLRCRWVGPVVVVGVNTLRIVRQPLVLETNTARETLGVLAT